MASLRYLVFVGLWGATLWPGSNGILEIFFNSPVLEIWPWYVLTRCAFFMMKSSFSCLQSPFYPQVLVCSPTACSWIPQPGPRLYLGCATLQLQQAGTILLLLPVRTASIYLKPTVMVWFKITKWEAISIVMGIILIFSILTHPKYLICSYG